MYAGILAGHNNLNREMAKKLLIDLEKIRKPEPGKPSDLPRIDGILSEYPNTNGRKSLRELALFRYTCRRCEDAPCIASCPADALDKNDVGMIRRSTNLCVACKSCVVICPFGTMMSDFFEHVRSLENYFDLNDPAEVEQFIKRSPEGAVQWVDMDENPDENIYQLDDRILIKDKGWENIKNAGG